MKITLFIRLTTLLVNKQAESLAGLTGLGSECSIYQVGKHYIAVETSYF